MFTLTTLDRPVVEVRDEHTLTIVALLCDWDEGTCRTWVLPSVVCTFCEVACTGDDDVCLMGRVNGDSRYGYEIAHARCRDLAELEWAARDAAWAEKEKAAFDAPVLAWMQANLEHLEMVNDTVASPTGVHMMARHFAWPAKRAAECIVAYNRLLWFG